MLFVLACVSVVDRFNSVCFPLFSLYIENLKITLHFAVLEKTIDCPNTHCLILENRICLSIWAIQFPATPGYLLADIGKA